MQTEDGLMHLMWHERTETSTKADPEDDIIVFPEEAKFEKVRALHIDAIVLHIICLCNVAVVLLVLITRSCRMRAEVVHP